MSNLDFNVPKLHVRSHHREINRMCLVSRGRVDTVFANRFRDRLRGMAKHYAFEHTSPILDTVLEYMENEKLGVVPDELVCFAMCCVREALQVYKQRLVDAIMEQGK